MKVLTDIEYNWSFKFLFLWSEGENVFLCYINVHFPDLTEVGTVVLSYLPWPFSFWDTVYDDSESAGKEFLL
jgi:hypothetical protein